MKKKPTKAILAEMGMKPFVAVFLAGGLFAIAADAPEDFRVVDGRLYNVQKSTNWLRLAGSPVGITNGFVLFQNVQGDRPWRPPLEKGGGFSSVGGFSGGFIEAMKPPKETPIGRARLNSSQLPPLILVRNLTSNWIGRDTNFLAMRVGHTNELQIWDVGVGVATNHVTPKAEARANREKPSP